MAGGPQRESRVLPDGTVPKFYRWIKRTGPALGETTLNRSPNNLSLETERMSSNPSAQTRLTVRLRESLRVGLAGAKGTGCGGGALTWPSALPATSSWLSSSTERLRRGAAAEGADDTQLLTQYKQGALLY